MNLTLFPAQEMNLTLFPDPISPLTGCFRYTFWNPIHISMAVMQVTLHQDQNLAVLKFAEVESITDLLKASAFLMETPGYVLTMNVLYDLRALKINSGEAPARYGQVEGLATLVAQRGLLPLTKIAYLVRDELAFGTMSMYVRSVSAHFELDRKIFLNQDDARKWLEEK